METRLGEHHPELLEAIRKKITQLQKGHATSAAREDAAQQRSAAKQINRKVAQYKGEQRRRQREELQGDVRELSEGMAKHVITRPPPVWEARVQEGRHGRRNRPGEGRRSRKAQGEDEQNEQRGENEEEGGEGQENGRDEQEGWQTV